MLRHHVQKSAADAKRYYQAAAADYYSQGLDVRPHIGGKAAERLGIAGPPDKETFDRLCDNRHPVTGEKLTARDRADRIVGVDFTFDADKALAVLEAFAPEDERRKLREARVQAELETIAEMERDMATRVRSGGREENRTTGEMLYYRVSHDTSRPVDGVPDMQPHEHYFVLNATWDAAENRWKAANLYDIIRDMPYHQAAFHARHAARVQELGYEVERNGTAFTVPGITKGMIDKYSRRTKQIEKLAAEKGITDPDRKAELGAQSREHKSDRFSPDQLRRLWLSWLTDSEKRAVVDTHLAAKRRVAEGVTPRRAVPARDALAHASAHVFERKSSAAARELLAEALAYGVGGFTVEEAWKELEKDGRFTAAVDGRLYVADRAVLAEERRVIALARDGMNTLAPIAPHHAIDDTRLNIPQRAAVHHLLGSTSSVSMVIGAAGVGKTTLLKEAERGANAAGLTVHAFAPSARASRGNLRKEGFAEATTVAALLASPKLQEQVRGQVVMVDEAAMLGTRETAQLLALAKQLQARVWLVGDDKQNPAVTRGSPFHLLRSRAGITPAVVTEVQRQSGTYKKLAETAREDAAAGFKQLQEMGWVQEVPDAERYKLLAADYLAATAPERKKVGGKWRETQPTALVVCPTHGEGGKVTAEIRAALKAAGTLGEERTFPRLVNLQFTEAQRADPHSYQPGDVIEFTQNAKGHTRGARVVLSGGEPPPAHHAARFQAFRPGTVHLAVGDRLRLTAGGKSKEGKRLDNGDIYTVTGFTKAGDIRTDKGRTIPKDYGHISSGYVLTTRSGQSSTVDRVLIAMGSESRPALNREQFYTDLTRARQWARAYTDNAKGLAAAVAKHEVRVSAVDLADMRAAQHRQRRAQRRERLTNHVLALRRRAAASAPAAAVDIEHAPDVRREMVNER